MQQAVKKLSEEFAKYNKESLISKLGALALFPENHSKKNRIRAALQAAICSKENGRKGDQISNSTLAGLLEQYFTPDEQIWQFEDPQEVLFTEIIKFHGGNFIIFPEVLADSHMALNLLLDFIFMEENNIPITFKKEVFYAAKSLLNMSNKIAQIMGFERYQNSPYSHHEPIFFGDLELMDKACNAINFRYDLVVGRNRVGFEQRANTLEWFICYEKSQMIEDDDLERIPLQTKPLSRFGDLLIVNQVASIPVSLVHFIISKIFEYKINELFVADYRNFLGSNIEMFFRRLGIRPLQNTPALSKSHPLYGLETVSRIDDDKLLYITLIPDLFHAYNKEIFFTRRNDLVAPEILQRRKEIITEYIANEFIDHEILFLDVYVPIGREYKIILSEPSFNHIYMSFADLAIIAHQESGKDTLLLWNYFLAEKDVLRNSSIRAFSFLDKYAFYSHHHDSFYFTDDARYPHITLEVGIASDLREEAYRKVDPHLVAFDHFGTLVPVERKYYHKEIDIYIPIIPELLPRLYVRGEKLSCWIHINIEGSAAASVRQIAWSFMEACAYWVWQILPELQEYMRYTDKQLTLLQFNLLDQQKWANYNYDKTLDPEQVSCLFSTHLSEDNVNINIPFEFAYLINGKNNNNDIVLLEWIIKSINQFLAKQGVHTTLDTKQLINKYCPRGKKSMILGFDSLENPMFHDHELPDKRLVSRFHVEQLLNDLALKAAPGYPVGAITDMKEKNKLCHAVVAHYFKMLQELIALFPASKLIHRLIGLSEQLWREKHIAGAKVTSRLACFGQIPSLRTEISEEATKIDEASVALRCLIEIVAAIPPTGIKAINNYDLDQMLALSKEIITWGGLSDEISFGINNVELGILPSGRLATGKDFLNNTLLPYNIAKRNEDIDDRIEEEEAIALGISKDEYPRLKENESLKEAAYEAEFKYPWDDILSILIALMEFGYEQRDGVIKFRIDQLIRRLKRKLKYDEEKITYVLDEFSLKSRNSWSQVPNGFTSTDIYPWRYNRGLSYMRKPLLQIVEDDSTYFYWGMRQVILSWQYLSSLIESGRYNYKTPLMGKYIGYLLNVKGKFFTQTVYNWLESTYSPLEIVFDREVQIDIKGKLAANKNYGDIDILIIIPKKKKIISIECKKLNPARTTSEFASELKKFESEWIGKHIKRHKWLQNNLVELGRVYHIEDCDQYDVRSVFLTSEKVPFPFITKNYKNLPFYDFGSLRRKTSLLYEM